ESFYFTVPFLNAATGTVHVDSATLDFYGAIWGAGEHVTTTFEAGGGLAFQIGGLDQYGQILLSGDGSLDGALTIQLTNGFVPHQGDQFTIIRRWGPSSISGTFTDLPEGATVWDTTHTYSFQISY